jgi:hypothetical protein
VSDERKESGPTKIWCPVNEGFRYTAVCERCKKKNTCEMYKEYREPKLAWS